MNPLFQAHCPQRGYLTKLCDHSYCSILSVAELRRSPDQVVAPFTHSHAAYEFLLPLTPMPIILQGTDVYFGRPGMVYPVQSGVRHGQALEQCDVANISLEVSPNFMVQRLREKGLDGAQFGPMFAVSERLRRFLRLFQEEFHGRRDEADLRCLAALVISELIECGCRPQPRPAQAEEQSADTLGAMEEFIYLHYTQPLTIDGLSAQCGMQRNHFITAFKRRFGETPYARIVRLRLAKAKFLLRGTDDTVRHISALCGFPSSTAFANAFRKDTGRTPGEFRDMQPYERL